MYQDQFVLLTQQLQQQMQSSESLNRLLNDGDKRRQMLQKALHSGDNNLQFIARKITTLEDLLPYRMRIDRLSTGERKLKKPGPRLAVMGLFALVNLGLIAGAIIAYEEIKDVRAQNEHIYAINNK